MSKSKYENQRKRLTPPHVSLADLRAASGLTLDAVCGRMQEVTGQPFSRGALSAIENGLRGASAQTLESLAIAYGLRAGAIRTDYQPRTREQVA